MKGKKTTARWMGTRRFPGQLVGKPSDFYENKSVTGKNTIRRLQTKELHPSNELGFSDPGKLIADS
jgi:hypothetical protein